MFYGQLKFPLFVVSIVLIQFAYGMILPCYETLINNYIPDASSEERATILSFGNLARSIFIALLGIPAGGKSAETTTMGWMIPAGLLIFVAVLTYFILYREEKSKRKGEEPGETAVLEKG